MKRKYNYYRVIQEHHCGEWHDSDFHETDSTFFPLDYKLFKENLKAYKENAGCSIRVINRREKPEKLESARELLNTSFGMNPVKEIDNIIRNMKGE